MDQTKSVCSSQVRHSGISIMSKTSIQVDAKKLAGNLSCPICKKICVEATTINICLHTFCQDCIYQKLDESEKKHCPVCGKDLGSTPEEFLRADESLRSIITTVFSNSKKGAAGSGTSHVNNTMLEVTKPIPPVATKALPQDVDASQKTVTKFHEESNDAGKNDQTFYRESSNKASTASKEKPASTKTPQAASTNSEPKAPEEFLEAETKVKQPASTKMPQAASTISEPKAPKEFQEAETKVKQTASPKMPQAAITISEPKAPEESEEAETKVKVQMKKKRNKNRRARQFSSGQMKDKEKIEPSNVQEKLSAGGSNGVDGLITNTDGHNDHQVSADNQRSAEEPKKVNHLSAEEPKKAKQISAREPKKVNRLFAQEPRRVRYFWFSITPHQDETGHAYPRLNKSFVRLKNAETMTVSTIQKFLKEKLNLNNESEVDILCCGETLSPSLTLNCIINMWIESIINLPDFNPARKIWDVNELVIELGYSRSKKLEAPEEN